MASVKRLAGYSVILAACIVFLLCVGGVGGVWYAQSRVLELGNGLFDAAGDSLDFLDGKLVRIQEACQHSHRRVGQLADGFRHLPQKDSETIAETKSLLNALNEEVFEPLRSAEDWLDSAQAVATGVSHVSSALASSRYAESHSDATGVALVDQLHNASDSAVEILNAVQDFRQRVVDLRDDAAAARRLALNIVARLAQTEERIARLCGRLERLRERVAALKTELEEKNRSFDRWITVGAAAAALLLAWFAASQIVMIAYVRPISHRNRPNGVG